MVLMYFARVHRRTRFIHCIMHKHADTLLSPPGRHEQRPKSSQPRSMKLNLDIENSGVIQKPLPITPLSPTLSPPLHHRKRRKSHQGVYPNSPSQPSTPSADPTPSLYPENAIKCKDTQPRSARLQNRRSQIRLNNKGNSSCPSSSGRILAFASAGGAGTWREQKTKLQRGGEVQSSRHHHPHTCLHIRSTRPRPATQKCHTRPGIDTALPVPIPVPVPVPVPGARAAPYAPPVLALVGTSLLLTINGLGISTSFSGSQTAGEPASPVPASPLLGRAGLRSLSLVLASSSL